LTILSSLSYSNDKIKVEEVFMLNDHLDNLGLVNLMYEKHDHLRNMVDTLWEEQSDIKISHTEWYIMHKIFGNKPTISDVSKNVTITRQATHKNIKSLQAKGLVEVSNSDRSKRDKCISLTRLGEQCCYKNNELKQSLEQKVATIIGENRLKDLIDIFKMDWGL